MSQIKKIIDKIASEEINRAFAAKTIFVKEEIETNDEVAAPSSDGLATDSYENMPEENVEEKIITDAKKLSELNYGPQVILNNIKSQIQQHYDDYNEATIIIKLLFETKNKTLVEVAKRLLLFIKGI